MGGTSTGTTTTQQDQKTGPWKPTHQGLKDIIGQIEGQFGNTKVTPTETGAIDQLATNATGGNPFAPQIANLANDLFAGGKDRTGIVNDAYGTYKDQMMPTINGIDGAYGEFRDVARAGINTAGGAYDDYKRQMASTINGDMLDPYKNPAFKSYLDTTTNDISDRINSMFAGAGRDLSGQNQGQLARGITEGTAPIFANQYNLERGNQLNAARGVADTGLSASNAMTSGAGALMNGGINAANAKMNGANALFGGGINATGTLSGLDQTALANRNAGIAVSQNALDAQNYGPKMQLAIEQMRRGLPLANIAGVENLMLPIAGLGGTSTGTSTSNTTQQMSGAQQFATIAGGIGNLANGYANIFNPRV